MKKKITAKKILKYVFIFLVVLLVLNILPSFFYRVEVNKNPLQSFYKKGVYHMHSVFSDGKGTIDEITNAAAALNLDFVILTDHGRPNIQSSMSTSWKNNVLLVGGSELSLHSGHLAVMGYKMPDYIFPPEPQEAINEIDNDKGVSFISHPFDNKVPWTDWDIQGFTGLEVLSSYSAARRAGILKILIFPLKYLIDSKYALLNTMQYPTVNIKKWDSLNSGAKTSHRYYGIYALDAHAKLPITKKIQLNFPTYKSMFEIMTVYVKVDHALEKNAHEAASTIVSSLREGNFFNVIEGIAPANGFDVSIEKFCGGPGGGFSKEPPGRRRQKLELLMPFDFETDVVVLKDGEVYQRIENNQKKKLEIEMKEPGVYRVEVYVPGNTFDHLPWIMTNPFFVGVRTPLPPSLPVKEKEVVLKRPLPDKNDSFKVEKNSRSQGAVTYESSGEDEEITCFSFKLVKESTEDRNFWSVMALRKRLNFSAYKGFVFEAKSDKKRRFWVEFRTGRKESEIWYRHSFLVDVEWKRYYIPFKKFHLTYGDKEQKEPELAKVTSIFFSINNANAYAGTGGTIFLKNSGLY